MSGFPTAAAFAPHLGHSLPLSTAFAAPSPLELQPPLPQALTGSRAAIDQVAFVDAALPDYQTLTEGMRPGTAVYVLNPAGDEFSQITQVLASYHNLSSVALFDHGSDGALQLGNSSLNVNNLVDYTGALQSWSKSLATGADLLLYGCDVAQDAVGQHFVQQVASLTGADVAASTDLTGSAALGGNWDLEFSTGSIETSEFLSPWAQAAYQHVLATYTVTNLSDSGTGSLRDAIMQANSNPGADTINFAPNLSGGTITLTSHEFILIDNAKTTINGGNAITISGNNTYGLFQVDSEATAELNGLTLTRGATLSTTRGGGEGAIVSDVSSTLTINNSVFSGNSGGLATFVGTLTVNNSTFSGNSGSEAGAISNRGTLTVNNSTFSGNSGSEAGAIYNIGGATVNNSTFSGNTANGTSNTSGGIYNTGGATVNNSTFSGNTANGTSNTSGGIYNTGGTLNINNSIIAGNSALNSVSNRNELVVATGAVAANNNLWGASSETFAQAFSGFTPSSTDILATSTTSTGTANNRATALNNIFVTQTINGVVVPLLADNGGPTQTIALAVYSPAIDAGNNALIPAGVTTDQRGKGRIQGVRVDIGAFESSIVNNLLWRNSATGQNTIWQMSNNTISTTTALPSLDASWKIETQGDFNGDGKSDILWRNTSTGALYTWLLNGNTLSTFYSLGALDTSWKLESAADFDGNGTTDLLWRNVNTGALYIWLMAGGSISSYKALTSLDSNWRLEATADFNRDGKADLLWHNVNTGAIYEWQMNGATISTFSALGVLDGNWKVETAPDFNGDGKSDLLWRNTASGQVYSWLMNGLTLSSYTYLGTLDTTWKLEAAGDFSGSGSVGLVWHNVNNGQVYSWQMNGATIGSINSVGSLDAGWQVQAYGYFNSDGRADLLWRSNSVQISLWQINNTALSFNVLSTLDPNWQAYALR